ncbi:unnamed protein product [Dimorphilus gyrociliatus]|uniref:Uncharacterized protein n=1 Tax=Dimorphilus gyrociliatus TaxID=2664684 RepID=A0A7I8VQC1_9ANNE|nr:unnamed protein product [Dimorphilus gyrociliatus]
MGKSGRSNASRASSGFTTVDVELETLMREFPEWRSKFPEICDRIQSPPRFHKSKKENACQPFEKTNKKQGPFPETHYQEAYRKKQSRVRSSKRPPPSPRDPNPPPMTFETWQRSEFFERENKGRVAPIKIEDSYEAPKAPLDSNTEYTKEYTEKKIKLPDIRKSAPASIPPKNNVVMKKGGKFDSTTTTKEHYKHWPQQPQMLSFGELPSFTNSVLYWDDKKLPQSTTQETFRGEFGKRPEMVKLAGGTLKPEGEMELTTTSKTTFKGEEGKRAEMIDPKMQSFSIVAPKNKGKFNDQTQFKRDFGKTTGPQPLPPRPVTPPPSTIDLKYNNRRSFETEQRREFKGIDVVDHPMMKSCKKESDEYETPKVKFETKTNQKLDYQPLDVAKAYQPPPKPPQTKYVDTKPPLDCTTMFQEHFKPYNVSPRPRFGDFHEKNSYLPPTASLQTSTTTGETFIEKKPETIMNYKPEDKPIALIGEHDFNTTHRLTYVTPKKRILKKDAKKLLAELRKLKIEKANIGLVPQRC